MFVTSTEVLFTNIIQISGMLRQSHFTSNSEKVDVDQKDANVIKKLKFAHIHHVKMEKMDIPAMKKIVPKNILYLGAKIVMISP